MVGALRPHSRYSSSWAPGAEEEEERVLANEMGFEGVWVGASGLSVSRKDEPSLRGCMGVESACVCVWGGGGRVSEGPGR